MRILIAGDENRGDWRLIWSSIALVEIAVGSVEVYISARPGVAALTRTIAYEMGIPPIRVREDWPASLYVDMVVLTHANKAKHEWLQAMVARAEALGIPVVSVIWIPDLPKLIAAARQVREATERRLTPRDLDDALATRHPRWIAPMVAELRELRSRTAHPSGAAQGLDSVHHVALSAHGTGQDRELSAGVLDARPGASGA